VGWLQLIGGGIDAAGKLAQGKQDAATGETNRRLGAAQADDALARGSIEEQRYRREIAQIVGAQKATFGARNVTVSGTALDLLSDTAQVGEEDALTIRNNAAREAWGYRNQANEASRWGANQRTNSRAAAGGTLLTSGAQAYGQSGGSVNKVTDWWKQRNDIAPVTTSVKRRG